MRMASHTSAVRWPTAGLTLASVADVAVRSEKGVPVESLVVVAGATAPLESTTDRE